MLNQVQLADQDLQLHVLFIPVAEATWGTLYKSNGSGQAPLINAVKGANVVIAGVGADVPEFATSLRAILFGSHVSAKMYPPMLGVFRNDSYQRRKLLSWRTSRPARLPGGPSSRWEFRRSSRRARRGGRR